MNGPSRHRSQRKSSSERPHRAIDIAIGIVAGVLLLIILDYTPLYRTYLTMIPGATDVRNENQRMSNGTIDVLWFLQARVINHGLRPGHVSRIDIVPLGVDPIEKVDIGEFDQGDFWPWYARTFTMHAVAHATPSILSITHCFKMNAYDDTGRLAFSVTWKWNPPPSTSTGTAAEDCKSL